MFVKTAVVHMSPLLKAVSRVTQQLTVMFIIKRLSLGTSGVLESSRALTPRLKHTLRPSCVRCHMEMASKRGQKTLLVFLQVLVGVSGALPRCDPRIRGKFGSCCDSLRAGCLHLELRISSTTCFHVKTVENSEWEHRL